MRLRTGAIFVVLALHALATACGYAAEAEQAPAARIVSLAPHLTELAFTAGAADRIVATVEYSDHPDAARDIPRIGDAFRVDLERLIAFKPDVVLAWDTGTPVQTIDRLRALGLRVELFKTTHVQDVADALRALGRLTETSAVAEAAAKHFEQDIERLREEYDERSHVRVFLQINDRPLYTVNGKHFISEIAQLCGGENVFANLDSLAPAVGIEAVIARNPQAIIATDDTAENARVQWRQWRTMDAVRAGNVFTLNSDDIARPTTRLAVAAVAMCRALDTARENLTRLRAPH